MSFTQPDYCTADGERLAGAVQAERPATIAGGLRVPILQHPHEISGWDAERWFVFQPQWGSLAWSTGRTIAEHQPCRQFVDFVSMSRYDPRILR